MMSEQRFVQCEIEYGFANTTNIKKVDGIYDMQEEKTYRIEQIVDLLNEQQSTIEHLRKQIQIYEQLISNSYVGEEETLDGFVGKYVIWENELQKYKEKIKGVFNE